LSVLRKPDRILNMTERVYIVFKYDVDTGDSNFREVFFTEEAATRFISSKQDKFAYYIQEYVSKEDGSAREIQ
jgi:hypothetical protein